MKKKIVGIVIILALVVCLSLTLGLTSTIAYAYDGSDSSSSDGVVLGLSYSESESGHTATITLDSDVEIVNYQFQLVFDSAMITIESVAFNEVEGFITDSNAGNITITVAGSAVDSLLYGGVDLVYINFAVNSGVVLTDYSVFTLSSSYDNYMSIKTSDTESYSMGIIANFDAFSYGSAVALLGDANLDGIIDIADAVAVLQHTTGSKTLTGTALINADVNCDNVVDVNDATDIQRHIAGLIDLNGTTSGGDDVDTDVDGNAVYNITFNANSGYFSNNETIITQQSNNWTIETPQHSDATFSYWYYYTVIFNDDGTATEVVSIFDSSTTITGDMILYAAWNYNTSGGSTDDDADNTNTCEVYVWGGVVWETSLTGLS